jgi:transcriptional regulator with XRE-family HTH domain
MSEKKYRDARKQAGIKLELAAVKLDVSIATLLNWERGVTKPNANNVRDMALLYGVTSDYLLGIT